MNLVIVGYLFCSLLVNISKLYTNFASKKSRSISFKMNLALEAFWDTKKFFGATADTVKALLSLLGLAQVS